MGVKMELFIVIVIVGISVVYIIKTFYNKYKIGKTNGSSCGCSTCGTRGTGCVQPARAKYDDFLNCESRIIDDV
jgi:hypothetical protein